jgi:hypothetical protein
MPVPTFDDFVKQQPKQGAIPTFDEFSKGVPGMEKLGGQPPPVPFGKPSPIPGGASVPAPIDNPYSVPMRALLNLPRSLHNFGDAAMEGLGPTASQPVRNPHAGELDSSGQPIPEWDFSAGFTNPLGPLANIVRHPGEAFAEDPVGTLTAARGAVEGGRTLARNAPEIGAAAEGAASGAAGGVRPFLSNFQVTKPLKLLPDIYDFGAGIYRGAKQRLADLAAQPTVRPRTPLSRQLGPSVTNLPGTADTSRMTVTTGEPLSYPGLRQLAAPPPVPAQGLRPPLRLGAGPQVKEPIITPPPADTSRMTVTTGEPLSYPGPRQLGSGQPHKAAPPAVTPGRLATAPVPANPRLASVHSGGFASGPQTQIVDPSERLLSNPKALEAARALQKAMRLKGE